MNFSDWISGAALLVSAASLWVSWHFGRPQRELAKNQLAAQKEGEARAKQAVLRLEFERQKLGIHNVGRGTARNIRIHESEDYDVIGDFADEFPIEMLESMQAAYVDVGIYMENRKNLYKFRLLWEDDFNSANDQVLHARHRP